MSDSLDLTLEFMEESFNKKQNMFFEFATVHPYFSANASEHEKKFMTREINPDIRRYATMMHTLAPKTCEKCNKDLNIPELCWREEHNIAHFFCYKCIGILEKEGTEIERDGSHRFVLKK